MNEKQKQERMAKVLVAAKDLHGKMGELLDEWDALLEGKASIGERMKEAELAFDAAWCHRYAPGQSRVYLWQYVKDRALLKRLLKAMTPAELGARAARYVASEDAFFVKNRHTFGLFVSSINQWAPARTIEAPADCSHHPLCTSDVEHTRRKLAEMRAE